MGCFGAKMLDKCANFIKLKILPGKGPGRMLRLEEHLPAG